MRPPFTRTLPIVVTLVATLHPARGAAQQADPFAAVYAESCAACHGQALEGSARGPALLGADLRHGTSVAAISRSIATGFPQNGMPAWSPALDGARIQRLAIYIAERRSGLGYTDFKVAAPLAIPSGVVTSEQHDFRVETVAKGLDPLPYSIAPLPDGRILVTEKMRGLRIVSADGTVSELVRDTPPVYADGFQAPGLLLTYGNGWMLDVAVHPDYRRNGWIYLHYTDRCSDCSAASRDSGRPVSMNTLVRGRIRGGRWVDQQTIWRADVESYSSMPDIGAGGRIAFDRDGHVFISIGLKGGSEYTGIQDLGAPYGKIHRVNDDGSIPVDNPFVHTAGALKSIWTYGHRVPQGLEYDAHTRQLWETEMGQRGGDEINLLRAGRNYGWPVESKGLKYDGTPVDYGKDIGIAIAPDDLEHPVVDLTPSPAVSSFTFYDGAAFPAWRHDMILGTLKATELYRVVRGDAGIVHRETLLSGIGRIRDVATGADGFVYLLIEHASGGRILRLVPKE